MKKITLAIIALVGMQLATNAQESTETMSTDFNKWSVELTGGVNKPVRPVSGGSFTNTPSLYTVTGGVRYMFNEKVGLKGGIAYNSFENDDNSNEFNTALYNFSLEGVINAGNILGFREWTNTFNVLVHGGMGYSALTTDAPAVERDFGDADQMISFMVGVTPQVRISDRIALVADLTAVGNVRQDLTFNGAPTDGLRGFDGFYVNATAGINIYLGKAEKHADWYSSKNVAEEQIADLQNRLAKVETDLIDTDQDGVADYLDREPNTISGVAVNTKGVAVDQNKNGVPDELESTLDNRYAKKGDIPTSTPAIASGDDVIKKLIEDGYVNVYFQFNSTKPETYSLESINYLIKYMTENAGASAQLVGYADEIGNASTNQRLSERRAQKVKDIMVAAGISASRLTATGNGEDASVDKNSAPARQLVRRVTFKLN
ncbi:OmpA family protein [Dokdonia donghaensis]|uniref:Cell envelope biogenesis protein OmpA n=1 Tax=Dokdonia donghaensis DSW-1 TaxID=1300343 RepID=A0A0A2GTW7_9FLAO|nr:OmpA family protein [Dokdonia donghaensis]ANH60800.1 Outer membrane porin F precursor [Dokdonia donghaensis DSW-1]KGO05938.1 cell envelope biogenesis protein OmpA [Dokdonia donghaensis DSW-1]